MFGRILRASKEADTEAIASPIFTSLFELSDFLTIPLYLFLYMKSASPTIFQINRNTENRCLCLLCLDELFCRSDFGKWEENK